MTDSPQSSVERARAIILAEAEGLAHVAAKLDGGFEKLLEAILACPGRIILTGMGKSGLVGRKITATLQSLGTPAYFLNPAEGFHGDLGLVQHSDLVILLSNSGATEELLNLLPSLRQRGVTLVALTGNAQSTLARACHLVCDLGVPREADLHDLAPTTSTTALLAFGDALAVVLFERRGLTPADFAAWHPGGTLGKRLLLRVEDLMHGGEACPIVPAEATFGAAVDELSRKHLGAVMVVDGAGALAGFLTDGDVRRIFDQTQERTIAECFASPITGLMTRNPRVAHPNELASVVLEQMRDRQHQQSPVVDDMGRVVGLVRLLDLIRAGL
ncbi:MAG: KpsF/GutQ family sugar-phosphate isomerase [bacterium]